jgi:membrane protease YdiL (CAAX protease family)
MTALRNSATNPAPAARVDLKGIVAYLLIAFGLTWAVDFFMIARGIHFDQMPTWAYLTIGGTMFFPALSGFIVRKWITREGFKSAGLRFGSWKPYVALGLIGPVVVVLIYAVSAALGVATFDPTMKAALDMVKSLGKELPFSGNVYALIICFETLTFAPVLTGVATFGEEFGWTGYLLPKLLPLGKWNAVVIYGAIWGLWHAPVVAGGYNYPGFGLWAIPMMMVACIGIGLVQTGLRLRYNSVFVTTWLHAVVNTQARGVVALYFVNVNPGLGGLAGLAGLVVFYGLGLWLTATAPETQVEA